MIELYLLIGLVYSTLLTIHTYSSSRRRTREHWAGIFLVGTLLWPIDLIVGNIGLLHNEFFSKMVEKFKLF
jgi:hypothetical protein